MAVATGSALQSTLADIPGGSPMDGPYNVIVIANGIASTGTHYVIVTPQKGKEKEKEKDKEKDLKEKDRDVFGSFSPSADINIADLARRIDRLEAAVASQRAFIREQERPGVGGGMLQPESTKEERIQVKPSRKPLSELAGKERTRVKPSRKPANPK
jgi:hypothetical protein